MTKSTTKGVFVMILPYMILPYSSCTGHSAGFGGWLFFFAEDRVCSGRKSIGFAILRLLVLVAGREVVGGFPQGDGHSFQTVDCNKFCRFRTADTLSVCFPLP